MPTRKEDRERRRAERLAAERAQASAERRRLILGYVVAGVLGAAVLAGIVIAIAGSGAGSNGEDTGDFPDAAHIEARSGFVHGVEPDGREGTEPPPIEQGDLERAAAVANCELQLELPDEGNTHVEDQTVNYKTNPPTSGNHNAEQQADGAYSEMPLPVHTVHTLEHGRIEIQYSPDLPEDGQLELKGVFDESPEGMLFFPNPDMPYDVAVTAWTNMLRCERYEGAATLDAIRDFRDIYRGAGPEQIIPIFFG
ncbi:MAG TPA: DUF3105 domain-containing protein [Solirubrobacterales bacterium]|jgi:Protein of unknown function (DUF3105)|nr:DUF3105 domain-containing protein [Solirubrobacterales bacterium]